ncbi:SURF1 family protein [Salinisphaera sp. USBA-960]|nr:SURF1 family protein [Salifodinibacter halophilus]
MTLPPWWGALLVAIIVPGLCALGVWQIQRAHYKERLQATIQAARAQGPQPLRAGTARDAANGGSSALAYRQRYVVTGRYDEAHQILLTDQSQGQRIGYRVWTPLVLTNGVRVMVDRGWIPRADEQSKQPPNPPAPDGTVRIKGSWRNYPQPGLEFGLRDQACHPDRWPRTLSYPGDATVACQYDGQVANGLLLLDPKADGGFVRDWEDGRLGLPPFAHYAYASQWFLGAVVAIAILVITNMRRRSDA